MFELDALAEPFEQAFTPTEDDRGDNDAEFVDHSGSQSLADDLATTHEVHLLVASDCSGLCNRLANATDKDELLTGWLFLGSVGDHEQWDPKRVLVPPMSGSLVSAPPGDHCSVGAHDLLEPLLVDAGRLDRFW